MAGSRHNPIRLISGALFVGTLAALLFCSGPLGVQASFAAEPTLTSLVAPLVAAHPGRSGVYVLEKGEEALLARAWLADHAVRSIDVQYFIWSSDNVGILAAEALLRAAERGVRVRVLVDDLLIDAPDVSLLALAAHPSIEIRLYNPRHSVGTSPLRRLRYLFSDFRGFNQRMHDKVLLVDGEAVITGGRNMADEYYDYDHRYNFRDRDLLLLGPVAGEVAESFQRFWSSPLAVPAETLLAAELDRLGPGDLERISRGLHAYAADPSNFAPEVKDALARLPEKFSALMAGVVWTTPRFLSDQPGKNDGSQGLAGGGRTTAELAELLGRARQRVTIQSPYLVMPEGALELFRELVARGVEVRISTNSLASTDNLQAFSGYRNQRAEILAAGIAVREFRPRPAVMAELVERLERGEEQAPLFAIHAKTLVIDGKTLFVGTFNFDPRSAHLNTEVGLLVEDAALARRVETAIERDMAPGNSWNPATDDPDREAGLGKRLRVRFWQLLPLEPLL